MAKSLHHGDYTVSRNDGRKWLRSADGLSHPRQFLPAAGRAARKDGDWLFLGGDWVGTEMVSPAVGFSAPQLCSGRRRRPSLAGLGGGGPQRPPWIRAEPRRARPQHSAAALATPPCHLLHLGAGGLPLAGPAAGARGAGREREPQSKALRRFSSGPPQPRPPRQLERGHSWRRGQPRLQLAWRERWKAGPAPFCLQPPITASAPRRGPPGRATTKLCLGSSETHPVNSGEVLDPIPS